MKCSFSYLRVSAECLIEASPSGKQSGAKNSPAKLHTNWQLVVLHEERDKGSSSTRLNWLQMRLRRLVSVCVCVSEYVLERPTLCIMI